jgi:hypothetical protein
LHFSCRCLNTQKAAKLKEEINVIVHPLPFFFKAEASRTLRESKQWWAKKRNRQKIFNEQ